MNTHESLVYELSEAIKTIASQTNIPLSDNSNEILLLFSIGLMISSRHSHQSKKWI